MTLMQVGRLLTELVAPNDWVASMGGDEFLIARPGCTAAEATALAATIQRLFRRETWGPQGHAIPLTCRIGVAVGTEGAKLIQQAGTALSFAGGKGATQFYTPELTRSATERLSWLKRGIARAYRIGAWSGRRDLNPRPLDPQSRREGRTR